MAEMGAEVIKVELFPNGDAVRQLPFMKDAIMYSRTGVKKVFASILKSPKAWRFTTGSGMPWRAQSRDIV